MENLESERISAQEINSPNEEVSIKQENKTDGAKKKN